MPALSYHRPSILKQIPFDRHAVIEANAGTGKTYTIQYLLLDLLLNTESSIEEILVVTFTEKATEELRSRIVPQAPTGYLPMIEATVKLGVSRQTVMQRVKRGELEALHVRQGQRKGLRIKVVDPPTGLFDQP